MSSLTSRLASIDRRLLAVVALLVIVLLTAGTVGGVYAYQQSLPITTTFSLKDGQKEVPLEQPLTLRLSRPVRLGLLAPHFHVQPAVDGKLAPSLDSRTYTFTPNGPWADLATYTVTLDTFKDPTGRSVTGATWHFTTTILPRVVAVTNDAGAAISDGADQPLGTTLHLAFNAAMNRDVTKVLVNGQPGALTWSDDARSATLSTKGIGVGALALGLSPTSADSTGHPASAAWKLALNLVFSVNVHTVPLRYPALVQVPNDPSARDQSGLQSADLVYEYATEGGITRFTAVFSRIPDKVGPVRSGRLISIKLTRHYRGMLFLSGTSEGTFGVLLRDTVPTFFDTQGYYYRTTDRFAPNNLYIGGDAIAHAEAGSPAIGAFVPPSGKPGLSGGAAAATAAVPDHRSTYPYDPATQTYLKTEDGHQFSDSSIGQPLHISMLVVLHTRVTTTGIVEDVNGVHGLDYDIDGSGAAELYYQGARYSAHWASPDRQSPLVFTNDAGQPISLPSGLVWVDVVA